MSLKYKLKTKKESNYRFVFVVVLCFFVLLGLWFRAFWIQIIWGPKIASKFSNHYFVEKKVQGYRGKILDRNGVVLAQSVKTFSVFARPYEVANPRLVAHKLAHILEIEEKSILKKLNKKSPFVWIKRKISDAKAKQIAENFSEKTGVYLTSEFTRVYPQGHLLGQVLGFTNIDGQGLEGLEKSLDSLLQGKQKELLVFKDGKGRLIKYNFLTPLLNGKDVVLTIDARIQAFAEEVLESSIKEFQAKHGQLIVASVDSGEILALANYPFLNPNLFYLSSPEERRNRAALDLFEPGSTAKPLVVAAALEKKIVSLSSIYFCEQGKWKLEDHLIQDTHAYGWLPINKIIRYSSNIGAGKIALELGAENYYRFLSALGFREKVDLPLPGLEESLIRPPHLWTKIDLAASAFGQSWATTGLHLVQAYLTLARKGELIPLRLLKTPKIDKKSPKKVFASQVGEKILKMLWEVVNEDGTGKWVRIEKIALGGKTGTAEKADLTQGGYKENAYIASFVGLFPALEPKYVVFLLLDEPQKEHYGGLVAGPGVKKVCLRLLSLDNTLLPSKDVEIQKKPIFSQTVEKREYLTGSLPDLRGTSVRQAMDILIKQGIIPKLIGTGLVVKEQRPAPGTKLRENLQIELLLEES